MTDMRKALNNMKYSSYFITGAGVLAVVVETARIVRAELLRQAVAHPIITGTTTAVGVGAIVTGLVALDDIKKMLRKL